MYNMTHMYIQAPHVYLQAPHVHPGTAAVNQRACSFTIKGSTFAIVIIMFHYVIMYSISKSNMKNIKKNIGILTIATGNL